VDKELFLEAFGDWLEGNGLEWIEPVTRITGEKVSGLPAIVDLTQLKLGICNLIILCGGSCE